MANESLLITMLPDGSFHVKETEAAGENDPNPPIDQSVSSPDEVTALVAQWLQGDPEDSEGPADVASEPGGEPAAEAGGAQAAWNQEAAKRPATGLIP